jgi:two-component system, OmpR family, response regulator
MPNNAAMQKKAARKVLIIEDEGEMCLLLNIIIDSKDIELDHVQNIATATEYLKKESPPVIILDNKLPDGFGVDFINYIKKNKPDTRIIMMSGYGSSVGDVALKNGADVFLEKPFTRDQIYEAIENMLVLNK